MVSRVTTWPLKATLVGTESLAIDDGAFKRATPAQLTAYTATIYDPTNVAGDAFDTDNHADGTTNKVFTAVEKTKLGTVEDSATADQTGAEIKSAYEGEADTNAFTDAEETKVGHITITQSVDLDTIEARVNALDAAVVLVGSWDASVGTFPGGGTAGNGESWIVSTGGTVDGVVFTANDHIIALVDNASTGTYVANWLKLDYTDNVLSVAGRIGTVVIVAADLADFNSSALSAAPAETVTTVGALINSAAGKTTPIDADYVGLMDSAASNILKKLSWVNIKATLKTYFDTLYSVTSHNHSGTYEPVDADILRADTADVLNAGFATTPYNAGTKTTGTYTPDEAAGNEQYAVNGGAHTLAPPTLNSTIIIQYTNNASAGAITVSGFTQTDGDAFTTTDGDDFMCYITKNNGFSLLTVKALQ